MCQLDTVNDFIPFIGHCNLYFSDFVLPFELSVIDIHNLKCLSIGTPKNNKFSICSKWKIHYFQVSQNLGRVQPHYNVLEYWGP